MKKYTVFFHIPQDLQNQFTFEEKSKKSAIAVARAFVYTRAHLQGKMMNKCKWHVEEAK